MSTPANPARRLDWKQVEELFHAALEQPPSAWTAWLIEHVPDPEMRREVTSLLHGWQRNREIPAGADEPRPEWGSGGFHSETFGVYQTVRLIGRGGMGAVYLARRADGQFEQTVAVKVIATHLAGDEFVARFRNERQLLASLNHPNITRLLDGAVQASGDPYLVMEYVEGEPLDRYCDARKLGVEARLCLFLQVCDAVEYAHRSLIVHRDLKPSNILVTKDGVVKLLDFGTAALAAQSSAITATRNRMVTPRYASPERLRGEPANTANDVFSLGVVLYELLTGAWPYGDPDAVINELKRAMGDAVPATPSTAVTDAAAESRSIAHDRLRRVLEGDLSAIVLKALENDPARRFGSVRQMAEDVERFLHGLPVQARTQTAWYRAGKFIRRRWVPVTAAAAVVLAMVVAAAISIRETAVAREEARRSQAVSEFLSAMVSSAAPQAFDPDKFTVTQLLDQAADRLKDRFKDDPRTEATLRENLGKSYAATFQYEKAKAQLARALALFRSLGDEDGTMRALKSTADYESNAGHKETSLALYRETLMHLNALGLKGYADETAYVKRSIAGELQWLNRDLKEAERLDDDVVALGRTQPEVSRVEVAKAIAMRADFMPGGSAERERLYQQALEMGRQEDPGGLWEAGSLIGLADVRVARKDFAGAAVFAHQRYELFLKFHGAERATTAAAQLFWARLRAWAGEVQQALTQVKEAVPVAMRGFPPDSLRLWFALRDAAVVCNLGQRFVDAEGFARETRAIAERAKLAPFDTRRGYSLWVLGTALAGQHRYRDAIQMLEQAETIYLKSEGAAAGLSAVRKSLQEARSHAK